MYNAHKLVAWLDISTYCNAACPQCHRTNVNSGEKNDWLPLIQWSFAEFVKAYPQHVVRLHEKFEICGTWGDPMMNKDIFEIINYIRKSSPFTRIQINTNGSIRNPEWWWDFGVMGGDKLEVWFDIDGINQEMHSLYRQKTDLDLIKDNVEAFCSTNAKACAHVIVFKHNQDYLYEIEEMIRDLGVTGKILFERSNRFYSDPKFKFTNHEGNELLLEEATQIDHPLINGSNPIRDHHWRKKYKLGKHELHD